jgi:transcription elongation GreA/GreB family factor
MERVGVMAEVAMAAATVTYPLVKVISGYLERRRLRDAKRFGAAAAAVEARLIERCAGLEARVVQLETLLRNAA